MDLKFVRPPVFHTETSSAFRIAVFVVLHIAFAIWLKHIVTRLPLGSLRVLTVLPILVVQVACPWFFDKDTEPLQVFCTTLIVSWQGTFKVLAFCWGRAPLRESMTVAQMTASLALPLFPKPLSRKKSGPEGRMQDSAGSGAALAVRLAFKMVLMVVVVFLYEEHRETMPLLIKHYLLAFIIYAMSGIIMDGPAAVVVEALQLPVLPTFDQPWMSASLAEFWGRRWNIPTTSVLRTVLYDTCAEGSLVNPECRAGAGAERTRSASSTATAMVPAAAANGTRSNTPLTAANSNHQQHHQQPPKSPTENGDHKKFAPTANGNHKASSPPPPPQQQQRQPSMLRRQLGLNAAFFVSGIVHEYMAWLLTGTDKLGWKWTFFFWVQAPLMTLEALASRLLRRTGGRLPRLLTTVLTHVVLQALALDLFFGYMEEQGVSQKIVGAIAKCIRAVLRPLLPAALGWLKAAGM